MHFAVIDLVSMKPVGTFALMRIDPANGVIEVGHVSYSVRMKRTRISTEVISLLLKYVLRIWAIAVLNGNVMPSMRLPVGRQSALASVLKVYFGRLSLPADEIVIPHGTQSLTASTRYSVLPTICGSMRVISIARDGRLNVLGN